MFVWIPMALMLAGTGLFFVVKHKMKLKDDSVIEEVLEDTIHKKTGIEVDLTPESPEKK